MFRIASKSLSKKISVTITPHLKYVTQNSRNKSTINYWVYLLNKRFYFETAGDRITGFLIFGNMSYIKAYNTAALKDA